MNTIQHLIELYEMISMNDGALRDSERAAILKARFALRMFEHAMNSFREDCPVALAADDSWLPVAA